MARIYRAQQNEDEPDEQSIEDLIEGHTAGGGSRQAQDEAERSQREQRNYPVGVRAGYTVSRPRGSISPFDVVAGRASHGGRTDPVEIGPRYFEDDVMKPSGSGRDSIIGKQQALLIAGYLAPTDDFVWGRWDPTTAGAYATLLTEANASGLTADAMLREAAMGVRSNQGPEGSGPGHWETDPNTGEMTFIEDPFVPPPLRVRTTNKDELRTVFRAAVRDRLGQGWSDAEINELVDAYNWKEIGLQAEAYRSEVDRLEQEFMMEGGGPAPTTQVISEVNAPSPEAFIETELRERDPAGFAAGEIGNEFAPAFFDALGGFV